MRESSWSLVPNNPTYSYEHTLHCGDWVIVLFEVDHDVILCRDGALNADGVEILDDRIPLDGWSTAAVVRAVREICRRNDLPLAGTDDCLRQVLSHVGMMLSWADPAEYARQRNLARRSKSDDGSWFDVAVRS
jgi:hypothetical protein